MLPQIFKGPTLMLIIQRLSGRVAYGEYRREETEGLESG
jgi:hypothetical protein